MDRSKQARIQELESSIRTDELILESMNKSHLRVSANASLSAFRVTVTAQYEKHKAELKKLLAEENA